MVAPLRQMTPVIAPRGGRIHITGLVSPGLTACRKRCGGWRIAPIAGRTTAAAIRASVTCEACQDAMERAVRAAKSAAQLEVREVR
jgi:hypothetical protein